MTQVTRWLPIVGLATAATPSACEAERALAKLCLSRCATASAPSASVFISTIMEILTLGFCWPILLT